MYNNIMYAQSDRATDRESRERRTRRNILTGLQTGWPRGHLRHRRVCNVFFFSRSSSSCGPFSTITLLYIIFILYSPVITMYTYILRRQWWRRCRPSARRRRRVDVKYKPVYNNILYLCIGIFYINRRWGRCTQCNI